MVKAYSECLFKKVFYTKIKINNIGILYPVNHSTDIRQATHLRIRGKSRTLSTLLRSISDTKLRIDVPALCDFTAERVNFANITLTCKRIDVKSFVPSVWCDFS